MGQSTCSKPKTACTSAHAVTSEVYAINQKTAVDSQSCQEKTIDNKFSRNEGRIAQASNVKMVDDIIITVSVFEQNCQRHEWKNWLCRF